MTKIIISKKAAKQYKKLPEIIKVKFNFWSEFSIKHGILQTRKIKSFHDEPLKGKLKDFRSIRLSKSYRAIYKEEDKHIEILVVEINNHKYKE